MINKVVHRPRLQAIFLTDILSVPPRLSLLYFLAVPLPAPSSLITGTCTPCTPRWQIVQVSKTMAASRSSRTICQRRCRPTSVSTTQVDASSTPR